MKKSLKVKNALLDLEKNHNHSLYDEIKLRSIDIPNKVAILYRGKKITYKEMFENVEKYVKSMTKLGIKENDEIPVCMANCPEFVYILLAASYLGVKVNSFGSEFDEDYIIDIINSTGCKNVFVSDDKYEDIKDAINESNISNVVLTSLCDSLPNGKDYYEAIDNDFYKFEDKAKLYAQKDSKIIRQDQFLELGKDVKSIKYHKATLDEIFTTTYSSGSTNSKKPKGIMHNNRSYITMGRFHDIDLSNAPSMNNLVVLAQIPTHSNTNIMSNITDTLQQKSTIALEPIYDKDFFLNSLIINKPSFCTSTRSFILTAAKSILTDEKYSNVKLSSLLALFSVGEATSKGEEKLINKALRKTKAGIEKLPIPTVLCTAGGDCEHGGIFYTMFKAWQDLNPLSSRGMSTHQMVSCVVLDENGEKCKPGQLGRLYASSPCNMVGYKDNKEATDKFFKIIDGEKYGDCSVYAIIGNDEKVQIKGRISEEIPHEVSKIAIAISDKILADTKNILSCEVIPTLKDGKYYFISHVEFSPFATKNYSKIFDGIYNRTKEISDVISEDSLYCCLHNKDNEFPLTGCGKRDFNKLKSQQFSNAFKLQMNNSKKREISKKLVKK